MKRCVLVIELVNTVVVNPFETELATNRGRSSLPCMKKKLWPRAFAAFARARASATSLSTKRSSGAKADHSQQYPLKPIPAIAAQRLRYSLSTRRDSTT